MQETDIQKIKEFATLCMMATTTNTSTIDSSLDLEEMLQEVSNILDGWTLLPTELHSELEGPLKQIFGRAVSEVETSFPKEIQFDLSISLVRCHFKMGSGKDLLIIVARIVGGSPSKYSLQQRLAYLLLLLSILHQFSEYEFLRTGLEAMSRLLDFIVVEDETGKFRTAVKIGGNAFLLNICFKRIIEMWDTLNLPYSAPQEFEEHDVRIEPMLKRMYQQVGVLSHYCFDVLRSAPDSKKKPKPDKRFYVPMRPVSQLILSPLISIHDLLSDRSEWEDLAHIAAEFLDKVFPVARKVTPAAQLQDYRYRGIVEFLTSFFSEINGGSLSQFSRRCFLRLAELLDSMDMDQGACLIQMFVAPEEEMGWQRNDVENTGLSTIHKIFTAVSDSEELEIEDQRKNAQKPFTTEVMTQTYEELFEEAERDDALADSIVQWAISGLRHPGWFTRFCAVLFFYQSAPKALISRLTNTLQELLRTETSSAVTLVAATFGNTLGKEEDIVETFKRCKKHAAVPCFRPAALIFGECILRIYHSQAKGTKSSSSRCSAEVNRSLVEHVLEFSQQSRPSWFFKNSSCVEVVLCTPTLRRSLLKVLDCCFDRESFFDRKMVNVLVEISSFLTGFAQYILSIGDEHLKNSALFTGRTALLEEEPTVRQKFMERLHQMLDLINSELSKSSQGAKYFDFTHLAKSVMPILTAVLTAATTNGNPVELISRVAAADLKGFFVVAVQQMNSNPALKRDRLRRLPDYFDAFLGLADQFLLCKHTSELLSLPEILDFLKMMRSYSSACTISEKLNLLLLQQRVLRLLPCGSLKSTDLHLSPILNLEKGESRGGCDSETLRRREESKRLLFRESFKLYWGDLHRTLAFEAPSQVCDFFALQMFNCLGFPNESELREILALDRSLVDSCLKLENARIRHRWYDTVVNIDLMMQQKRCSVYCTVILEGLVEEEKAYLGKLLKILLGQIKLLKNTTFDSAQSVSYGLSSIEFWCNTFRFATEIANRLSVALDFLLPDDDSDDPITDSTEIDLWDFLRLLSPYFLTFIDKFLIPASSSSSSTLCSTSHDLLTTTTGPAPHYAANLLPSEGKVDPLDSGLVTNFIRSCEECSVLCLQHCPPKEEEDDEEEEEELRGFLELLDSILEKISSSNSLLQHQPLWLKAAPVLRDLREKLVCSSDKEEDLEEEDFSSASTFSGSGSRDSSFSSNHREEEAQRKRRSSRQQKSSDDKLVDNDGSSLNDGAVDDEEPPQKRRRRQ